MDVLDRIPPAKIYTWSVICFGTFVYSAAVFNLPIASLDIQFYLLAAFTLAFGSYLTLQIPGAKVHIMMLDAAVFLTLLLYGGEAAIAIAGIDAVLSSLKLRRAGANIRLRTVLFNFALITCSIGSAHLVRLGYEKVTGHPVDYSKLAEFISVLGMMALAAFVVNSALGAIYTAFKNGNRLWDEWNRNCLSCSLTYITGATVGGLIFKFIELVNWLSAAVIAIVIVVLYLTYRRYVDEIKRSMEQAEQAERQKAEVERLRAEEAEKHIDELSKHIAEQNRIGEALRVSKERFRHAALHDALTGLPNRSFFTEQLKYLLDKNKHEPQNGFCVLFIDLDRFKNVNDSLGHAVGDELLILVGKRLEHIVRQGDMVSRLGGDEFALVLINIGEVEDAAQFAERIFETISQPFKLHGHQVFSAPSIGIAMSSAEYEQPDDILRDADIAMYHAKENGGGCAVFDRELRTRAVNILRIETDLRYAIEREELRVYFQPIIALESGRLAGFEALMRWQHPERGLVSPVDFIPVAEDTGLIVPMTIWILRESCMQLSRWRWQSPLNRSLLVSVNLSGKHFTQPDLVDQVRQILHETGLEPHCLKLEITESAVMENAEDTARVLSDLRDFDAFRKPVCLRFH
ncbi:MAG TPA: diguanylate cyclase [Pyrinomonadaceae bacterium]|nr:diguanylate cyclase [Pyrinomonadaceae bacterium]